MNMIKWTMVLAGVVSAAAASGCCCGKCGAGMSAPSWMTGSYPAAPAAPAYPPAPVTYPGPATYSVPPGGAMPGPVSGAPTNVQYPTSQIPTQNTNYK
jgi:hypothetical protein